MVGGEGVEDLVGAPLKRGCRGGGVGLARVCACVVRQPSPFERGTPIGGGYVHRGVSRSDGVCIPARGASTN